MRVFSLVFACLLCGDVIAADFESDIQSFSARHTFPNKWLRGPHHTVDADVINQNFMNHYRIGSRFGVFTAIGNDQLFVRIREIEALARLEDMSKSRVFVNSVSDTVTTTVERVGNAVEDPERAADDMGSGFSRLVKRLGRMGKNAYEKGKSLLTGDKTNEERSAELADTGTNMAKGFLGVNSAYRTLARDLGVDPYTRNNLLREEIEGMANYAAAGSFGVKTIVPVLPMLYGAGYLISVSNLVWNTHPIDLQLRNEKALRDMGMRNKWIRSLFENDRHTLTTQTRIVNSLERLKGMKGRKVLLHHAAQAKSISEALYYTRMIELLAMYHQQRGAIDKIVETKGVPFGLTKRKRAVVMLPVDYLRWTKAARDLTHHLNKAMSHYSATHLEFWVNGQVSPKARVTLGNMGWALFDRAGARI